MSKTSIKENDLRRKKYALVFAATKSVELARAARKWSNARIMAAYGSKIPAASALKIEKTEKNFVVVYNATGSVQLASAARKWSESQIMDTYGARVPKTAPKLKILTPKQIKRKAREIEKFQYGRKTLGLDFETARSLKQYTKRKLITTSEYLDAMELASKLDNTRTRQDRYDLWVKWSHDKALPPIVHHLAIQKNRSTKNRQGVLRDDSDYGYTIAFAVFVDQMTMDQAEKTYAPDPWDSVKVMYMDVARIRR